MTTKNAESYCNCCGAFKPEYDFPRGRGVCSTCSMLDIFTAVEMSRESLRREITYKTQTARGRKQARMEYKIGLYEKEGKRCTGCHYRKPPEAYNKCAPTHDGLQPMCKACNKLWLQLRKEGGNALWRQVRDALRKASPEGK